MIVRKLSLAEWFTDYQLQQLSHRHFHLPFHCKVDISRLVEFYRLKGRKAPISALVIKAAALTAKQHPPANRAIIRGLFGTRLVQFSAAHVNLPIHLEYEGRKILSAIVIRSASELTVDEIAQTIQDAKQRSPLSLPIARILARKANHFFNRLVLRFFYHIALSTPQLYGQKGGGISVSSLVREGIYGAEATVPPYGPTAFAVSPGQVILGPDGKTTLLIGIGYDHCDLAGYEAVRCIDTFLKILLEGDPDLLGLK